MSRKWIVLGTVAAVVLAFVAGVVVFTNRSNQEVKQAAHYVTEAPGGSGHVASLCATQSAGSS